MINEWNNQSMNEVSEWFHFIREVESGGLYQESGGDIHNLQCRIDFFVVVEVSEVYLFWWGSTVSVPGRSISRAGVDGNTRSRLTLGLSLSEGDHRDGEADDGEQGGLHIDKKIDKESLIWNDLVHINKIYTYTTNVTHGHGSTQTSFSL